MEGSADEPCSQVRRPRRKSFGGVHAVDDVSFDVAAGELLALIGPNGAGKTTCFNMVNGQLAPDAGSILLDGVELDRPARRAQIWRLGVGRTFQIAATFALDDGGRERADGAALARRRSCSRLWRRARSAPARARRWRCWRRSAWRTQAERPCSVLAYGDVKRVELAIALANEPRLLLMDEPTAGMAPQRAQRADGADQAAGRSSAASRVLFTEHSMDVVFAYADRIIVLARGELIAEGNAADDPRRSEGAGGLFRHRQDLRTRDATASRMTRRRACSTVRAA